MLVPDMQRGAEEKIHAETGREERTRLRGLGYTDGKAP